MCRKSDFEFSIFAKIVAQNLFEHSAENYFCKPVCSRYINIQNRLAVCATLARKINIARFYSKKLAPKNTRLAQS